MKKERVFKLLGFLVFYLTLSPISCYTSSNLEVLAYVLFISLIIFYNKKIGLFRQGIGIDKKRTIALFFIAFFIPAIIHFQTPFVTDILQWIAILVIISLKNEYRDKILNVAVLLFCIVLLFSIVEYLIGFTTGVSYTVMSSASSDVNYTQSFFNIYRYGNLTYRFTALANEPGALGATCGFILAFLPAKKRNLFPLCVCLVGGILSLSLAFYIYLGFILLYKTLSKEINFKYTLLIAVVFACMVTLFYEEIQTAIVLRLTEAERLDNRSSEQVNQFIIHIFDSPNALYGVGNKTAYILQEGSEYGNAGLKWKLYQYGVVGCGCYFLAMFLLYKRHRNRNVSFLFGIIFFVLYFYSVGRWGIPMYMLLLFTTQIDSTKVPAHI